MTERLPHLAERLVIMGNADVILGRRFSDGGVPPSDGGAVSEMMERLPHLAERLLILGNAAVI
jgi:hypothetical protein